MLKAETEPKIVGFFHKTEPKTEPKSYFAHL